MTKKELKDWIKRKKRRRIREAERERCLMRQATWHDMPPNGGGKYKAI